VDPRVPPRFDHRNRRAGIPVLHPQGDSFTRPGFSYQRLQGALAVTGVEKGGPAEAAGLSRGDRIITADGQTASSLPQPEKSLARKPFPHRLLVLSGGEVKEIHLQRPRLALDRTYLFLAFVGFLYLLIGLFTASRDRAGAARIFGALCLSSFAIYVITPAGPRDAIWKAFLLSEDFYRAFLPALLLHFFLVFPRSFQAPRRWIPLLYLPGLAWLAFQESPLLFPGAASEASVETATRLWETYFAIFGAAAMWRLARLLRRSRDDAESQMQVRWIGLGVAVGLAPFLLLSVLPRIVGLASPLLSSVAVVPLVLIPLAFAYAILKWRLWDVEIFVREALATTAAVLLGGITFVLLHTLLDRTLEGMAEAGKNVVAFGTGIVPRRAARPHEEAHHRSSRRSSTTRSTARAARFSTSPATSRLRGRRKSSPPRSSSASRTASTSFRAPSSSSRTRPLRRR
jgi:hypothetical protein